LTLHIRLLQKGDIEEIAAAFHALGWNKPASQYERYLAEQEAGQRTVFVAFVDNIFAGYITINWHSDYPPFRAENIPEIQDFNVLPPFRRQGIGSRLMDEAEQKVAERSAIVGIGVGLYADYGTAQRMYARRGYIPDGRGIVCGGRIIQPGEQVTVDDDLTLQFTKQLKPKLYLLYRE
jgi:GNAT superfamily N-acetyltransferase